MIEEKEFIEDVKRKSGYIDYIDAFKLIHLFTEKYGVIYTELSIEDELIYMWIKLQENNNNKICKVCKVEKDLNDFYYSKNRKDNKDNWCAKCRREYRYKYFNKK